VEESYVSPHKKNPPDIAANSDFISPISELASEISSINEIKIIIPAENPIPQAIVRSFRRNHNASITPRQVVRHDKKERTRTATMSV
jgi:hypothetical protein